MKRAKWIRWSVIELTAMKANTWKWTWCFILNGEGSLKYFSEQFWKEKLWWKLVIKKLFELFSLILLYFDDEQAQRVKLRLLLLAKICVLIILKLKLLLLYVVHVKLQPASRLNIVSAELINLWINFQCWIMRCQSYIEVNSFTSHSLIIILPCVQQIFAGNHRSPKYSQSH